MKLINDSCEKVLPSIKNISLIIADIPWNRDYNYTTLFNLFKFKESIVLIVDDTLEAYLKFIRYASSRWCWMYQGVWIHGKRFSSVLGFVNSEERRAAQSSNILNFPNIRETTFPEERPVKLMEYIIKHFSLGGLVVDPFMGSGSSAIAARNLGNDYIGIEKNSQVYELARERING